MLGHSGVLITFFVLLFTVALPVVVGYTVVLPRYYVVILPFLLLWVGYAVKRLVGHRPTSAPVVCFALLSMFFALNSNGVFYPLHINTEGPAEARGSPRRTSASPPNRGTGRRCGEDP